MYQRLPNDFEGDLEYYPEDEASEGKEYRDDPAVRAYNALALADALAQAQARGNSVVEINTAGAGTPVELTETNTGEGEGSGAAAMASAGASRSNLSVVPASFSMQTSQAVAAEAASASARGGHAAEGRIPAPETALASAERLRNNGAATAAATARPTTQDRSIPVPPTAAAPCAWYARPEFLVGAGVALLVLGALAAVVLTHGVALPLVGGLLIAAKVGVGAGLAYVAGSAGVVAGVAVASAKKSEGCTFFSRMFGSSSVASDAPAEVSA